MRHPKLTCTARLPSVEECEACAYQNDCQCGKYCVASERKGQPTIHNKVIDRQGAKRKCKTV